MEFRRAHSLYLARDKDGTLHLFQCDLNEKPILVGDRYVVNNKSFKENTILGENFNDPCNKIEFEDGPVLVEVSPVYRKWKATCIKCNEIFYYRNPETMGFPGCPTYTRCKNVVLTGLKLIKL